jgi:spore coat protein CotH
MLNQYYKRKIFGWLLSAVLSVICLQNALTLSGQTLNRIPGSQVEVNKTYDDMNSFYDPAFVHEVRFNFTISDWDHALDSLFLNFGEDGRLAGDVSIDGHVFHGAGIRFKGFSSWDIDNVKNPFNVELDFSVKNQNYLGFTKLKLGNVIHDPSFVREVLAYEIARKYMPASRSNFTNLYINNVLIGLYTSVEAVDGLFTKRCFGSDDHSFFKGSPEGGITYLGQNANLAYTHGSDTTGYMPYYKNQNAYGWDDLLNFIYILNLDTIHIDNVLNTDRTLWMHAFNYAIVNLDSYIGYSQNYYLYMDDNNRFNPILWDLNMSFGSFRNSDGTSLSLTINKVKQLNPLQYLTSPSYTPRPLLKNLLLNTTYRKMYLAHMRTIINENFRTGWYYTRAQELQGFIDADVQNDTNKFYSYADFISNIDTTTGPAYDMYPGIKDLMEARIAYLDTFPGFKGEPVISEISHYPLTPVFNEQTWIRAKVSGASHVTLAYRNSSDAIFSKLTMFDDGAHQDGLAGDSVYGVSLIANGIVIQYYLWAENDSAGEFSPERAEYEFYEFNTKIKPGDLVINEIMTDNSADGNWIELFNNTNEALCLDSLYLSNDFNDPLKWAFPDTTLPARGFMVILGNGENPGSGLSSNFTFNPYGGEIMLSYPGSMIDSFVFPEIAPEKTIGRYPNGYGSFVYMMPTYAKTNYVGTTVETSIILFPNPATDMIYIELINNNSPLIIRIFNSEGRVVYSEDCQYESLIIPAVNKSIDVSSLKQGVYLVRIICGDEILCRKLIIY